MPKPKVTPADLRARRTRQEEWRAFRRDHLFSQRRLAEHLGVSIRTVQYVESAAHTPIAAIQSKFETLKALHSLNGRRAA